MNGESTYVVIAEFNLACVESGADFDAELASAYGDGLAATYGAGRAIKGGEDAVPGCLYEAAPLMLTESVLSEIQKFAYFVKPQCSRLAGRIARCPALS